MVVEAEYDIIVVGGGTAGVIAALQAARGGMKTLLIEKTEMLGGTITNARVIAPGLFHAWKKQIIKGIGWELVTRCVSESGGRLPEPSMQNQEQHWTMQIPINIFLYAMLCDEALMKAGCTVLLDTMCAGIREVDGKKEVCVCTKTGLRNLKAKVVIDCTGDANVAQLAGYPVERSAAMQPSTYICRIGGFDLEKIDMEAVKAAYDEAVRKGNLRYTDLSWNATEFMPKWLYHKGDNANHVFYKESDGDSSEGRSQIAVNGRLALLNLYRFFRKQKGFENFHFTYLAPECGVRETVRIKGKSTITLKDFIEGKCYEDAVCYSFYPIDLHVLEGEGLENIYLEEGKVPTIPRSAMLPENSSNFLVAGRCISSEQSVNSAIRVAASCMAMGQAAGAIAVLAVKQNKDVEEVAISDIHEMLKKHGAIVPINIVF